MRPTSTSVRRFSFSVRRRFCVGSYPLRRRASRSPRARRFACRRKTLRRNLAVREALRRSAQAGSGRLCGGPSGRTTGRSGLQASVSFAPCRLGMPTFRLRLSVARGECCDEPHVRIRPLSCPKLFRAFGKPRRDVFRRLVGYVILRRSLSSARLRACSRPRSSLRVSSDEYPFGMLGFPSVFRAKVRVAAFPVFRCSRSFVSAVRGCLSFLPKFRRFPFGSVAGRRSHALRSPGPVAVPSSRTGWSAAGRGRSERTAAFPCRIVPSGKKTGGGPSGPSPVGSMRFSRFRASNPGGIDSADACRLPGRP